MPKISMISGERLFIEFVLGRDGAKVPERLMIRFDGGRVTIDALLLSENETEVVSTETILEVQMGKEELKEVLAEIFGDSLFVMDEHGMRKAKPKGNN